MFVDWIDGYSIGHDPLIYIEGGGLIPVGNLSKPYFSSFPRVWNSSDRNPKDQIRIGFSVRYVGSPELGRNFRQSELPTFVETPDVGITLDTRADFFRLPESPDTHQNFRQSKVPTWVGTPDNEASFRGHNFFIRLRIRHSIYVF